MEPTNNEDINGKIVSQTSVLPDSTLESIKDQKENIMSSGEQKQTISLGSFIFFINFISGVLITISLPLHDLFHLRNYYTVFLSSLVIPFFSLILGLFNFHSKRREILVNLFRALGYSFILFIFATLAMVVIFSGGH